MKVAIIADWLTNRGGAEVVIDQFHKLFPDAPIFTSLYCPEKMGEIAKTADIRPSYLNTIPFANRKHTWMLPWLPSAVESFDLSAFDVVISSSHSVAKGVITKPETLHLCYCHTPMRYAWDMYHQYVREAPHPWPIPLLIPGQMHAIRQWDRLTADRVDFFVANSKFSAQRIEKYYQRTSEVLSPPVTNDHFQDLSQRNPKGYFLAVGRQIPYKKFDLLIEAANRAGFRLKIAGKGPEHERLKKMAGKTVEMLGFVSDEALRKLYLEADAFLFPQIEDAGIVPLEAMAAGVPVIAYRAGGALDTIIEGKTGLFFEEQTVESLLDALARFSVESFDAKEIQHWARTFSEERFRERFSLLLKREMENHKKRLDSAGKTL